MRKKCDRPVCRFAAELRYDRGVVPDSAVPAVRSVNRPEKRPADDGEETRAEAAAPEDADAATDRLPYAREAYLFVFEALQKVQDELAADGLRAERSSRPVTGETRTGRHITAAELCEGFRKLAVAQFGGLARTVLRQWRVRSTEDVGRIVFELVERGELCKCDGDRPEDFAGLFDFDATFAMAFDANLDAVTVAAAR
ncbi:MAG: Minf_1886 family protein [Planctomycetota bacterium]